MSKSLLIVLGLFIFGIVSLVTVVAIGASYHNQENQLRRTIEAKVRSNKSELDMVKKSIVQTANVTEEAADLIVRAIQANAVGREGGQLLKFVTEAVPNADLSVHKNLMNIITSQRQSFNDRQKELSSLKAQHDTLLGNFPGNIVFMVLGRQPIEIPIVTSTAVENAFATGKDDDTELFRKK